MSPETCRIDVWLWRARFARTRSHAGTLVESGAIRLTHNGTQTRVDKVSRSVHVGDVLVFAIGGHVTELTVEALGERRGPATEARALYQLTEPPPG
jgi:ribosome-associated heat shock protein Hsp15